MIMMWGAIGSNLHDIIGIIVFICALIIISIGFAAWVLSNRLNWNSKTIKTLRFGHKVF